VRPVAIIGDIHGESTKLRALLTRLTDKYGECDLYGVGDFIDRGPNPKEVIQIAIDKGIQGILGNHEIWLHKFLSTGIFGGEALHFMMGGHATLASYGLRYKDTQIDRIRQGLSRAIPEEHKAFILGLPLFRKVEMAGTTYWLVHGGVKRELGEMFMEQAQETLANKGIDPNEFSNADLLGLIATVQPDSLLWEHFDPEEPDLYEFRNGDVQVFGHKAVVEPIDGGHFIAVDTGCGRKNATRGRNNFLSAVVLLPEGGREFVTVE